MRRLAQARGRGVLVCVVLALLASLVSVGAQRAQSPLEIGGMSHTRVDEHDIIIVLLSNTGDESIQARGDFTLTDSEGNEVAQIEVTTGAVHPESSSVLSVPVNVVLEPGRYTVTLTLEDHIRQVRANSGLREVLVQPSATPPIEESPVPVVPLEQDADDTPGNGFPSWLLLIIGLSVTVVGVTLMRGKADAGRKATPRPIPEVSMVRKVSVTRPPPKRPATIKPLLPPRNRRPDGEST